MLNVGDAVRITDYDGRTRNGIVNHIKGDRVQVLTMNGLLWFNAYDLVKLSA